MSNAPGAQQNPQYCMIAGALNVSFDNGATWTPIGGSGGTVQTAAPVSGDGSSGNKVTIANGAIGLTKLATQAANTLVGNGTGSTASPTALTASQALSALGIGSGSWRQQMFAFAQSKYATIGRDILTDFSLGATTSDYTPILVTAGGSPAANFSSGWPGGGVEMDTGNPTTGGNGVKICRRGNPATVANMLTGGPWFVATRQRLNIAVAASANNNSIAITQINPFTAGAPALGVYGSTSTAFYTLYDGTAFSVTTGAIVVGSFIDLALGFDGVTLTAYVGQVASGTLTAVGTSTTLTNIPTTPGQPGTSVSSGDTTRITCDVASLYGASANP